MWAVDKAWDRFWARSGGTAEVRKYRFDCLSYDGGPDSSYYCLSTRRSDVYDADYVVFWGDFLQMNSYQLRVAEKLVRAGAFTEQWEAIHAVRYAFLAEGVPRRSQPRIIGFGGTLALDESKVLTSGRYADGLTGMLERSEGWLTRDPYSAGLVARLTNSSPEQGVDCAMLYWDRIATSDHYPAVRVGGGEFQSNDLGVFFGRSRKNPLSLVRFSKELGRRIGARPTWIPWFRWSHRSGKRDHLTNLMASPMSWQRGAKDREGGDALAELSDYCAIVTDTYHLAVNAWAAGVPAICVGDVTSNLRWDVNSGSQFSWRDKRYLHYLMYDGLDFFVHRSELASRNMRQRRLEHLEHVLLQSDLHQWIDEQMRRQANAAEARLLELLRVG